MTPNGCANFEKEDKVGAITIGACYFWGFTTSGPCRGASSPELGGIKYLSTSTTLSQAPSPPPSLKTREQFEHKTTALPPEVLLLRVPLLPIFIYLPLSLVSDLHICWNTVGCLPCSSDQLGVSLALRGSGLCFHLSHCHLCPPMFLDRKN